MKLFLLRLLAVALMWSTIFCACIGIRAHSWTFFVGECVFGANLVVFANKVDLK